MSDPKPFKAGMDEFADEQGSPLAAAMARVAAETPEQRAEAKAADEAEAYAEDAAIRTANRRARYQDARPLEYAAASLKELLPQQDPNGRGRGWLISAAKNALIMGPSGHGKTRLAYAIGNAACDRRLWVEAWPVLELVQALAPLPVHARRDEARSQRQENILDWAKSCDLLILDDLGAEEATGYVAERWRSQLLDILSARDTDSQCRTIVTINGAPTTDAADDATRGSIRRAAAANVATRYSARVSTRLQRDCVGIWVEGECLRKAATWDPFR